METEQTVLPISEFIAHIRKNNKTDDQIIKEIVNTINASLKAAREQPVPVCVNFSKFMDDMCVKTRGQTIIDSIVELFKNNKYDITYKISVESYVTFTLSA